MKTYAPDRPLPTEPTKPAYYIARYVNHFTTPPKVGPWIVTRGSRNRWMTPRDAYNWDNQLQFSAPNPELSVERYKWNGREWQHVTGIE